MERYLYFAQKLQAVSFPELECCSAVGMQATALPTGTILQLTVPVRQTRDYLDNSATSLTKPGNKACKPKLKTAKARSSTNSAEESDPEGSMSVVGILSSSERTDAVLDSSVPMNRPRGKFQNEGRRRRTSRMPGILVPVATTAQSFWSISRQLIT